MREQRCIATQDCSYITLRRSLSLVYLDKSIGFYDFTLMLQSQHYPAKVDALP